MMRFGGKYAVVMGVFACMFLFIGMTGRIDAADVKIVSIDTGKVVEAHPAFKEAMENFQVQMGAAQKKVEEMENEEEKSNAQVQMQQQMRMLAMQMQEDALKKVKDDIQKFAKQKGYTYVIDKNALIVGGKDITEEIIASFEKK